MATHTKATGGTSGHASTRRRPYWVENTVDYSLFDPAADDLVQHINVPAETVVMAAGLEVLTASASGVTLDLGWTATSGNLTTDVDVITEIEKQYEYARAYGHTNRAIKALELLSRIRGAKSETEIDMSSEGLEANIIENLKVLGKEKVMELIKKCGF